MREAASDIQQTRFQRFYDLHHSGKLLILPNIWDPLGALLLQDLSFPAVATASAAVAYSNGYDDGENISFEMLLALLKNLVSRLRVPVTADIETGFGDEDGLFEYNIRQLVDTGIAGINIEDSDKKTNQLLPAERLASKIRAIKRITSQMNKSLFVNARCDVYVRDMGLKTPEEKIGEALMRGQAYKEAGADCFYPITMNRRQDIEKTVQQLAMPVNILVMEGIPSLRDLEKMGVARVTLGPGFLKVAIRALKDAALNLQDYGDIAEIAGNEITSPYLKKLVTE